MGFSKYCALSLLISDYRIAGWCVRVIKQRRKTPKPFGSTLKLRNELLKTKIDEGSELMQISKRNAIESPLLHLPGEIRNKIWEYVLSNHLISIHGNSRGSLREYVHSTDNDKVTRVSLGKRLLSACRQIHEETSTMFYAINTISFNSKFTLDLFLSHSTPQKLGLITSMGVPYDYYKFYNEGYCKKFHEIFPNVKHLSIDDYVAGHRQYIRRLLWTPKDSIEKEKK